MNLSTIPGSEGAGKPAVPLQLRLVHSRGRARDTVLVVAAGGLGMADALELGGERLSDAQWRAANLCRIAWQGTGSRWELVNGSPMLVCALNGERVSAQRPFTLAPGDSLELGLLRFVVEAEEVARPPVAWSEPPSAPPVSTGKALTATPSDSDAEAAFELRDLARPADDSFHVGVLDGPFGVLDIAGAEASPAGDPLAQLLGEAVPPARVMPSIGNVEPLEATAYEPDRTQQGRASAVTQRLPAQEPTVAYPVEDLFADLHAEYVRVVGDPTQLAGRIDWKGFLAPAGEREITIEALNPKTEHYPLVLDIVQSRESIDQIIENFDPLGRSSLLDEETTDDVLRLFAAGLARNAKPLVPSLTRREHHELSPDSYMHVGSSLPDDKDGSK